MSNNQRNFGIRELIRSARDVDEVDRLLNEGKTFEQASPKTRRAWARTAGLRLQQLFLNPPSAS